MCRKRLFAASLALVLALASIAHAQPMIGQSSAAHRDENSAGNLIIDGETFVLDGGEYSYNTVQVLNGGTLSIRGSATLNATVIAVDATSSIIANGVADNDLGRGNDGGGGGRHDEGGGGGGGGHGGRGGPGGYGAGFYGGQGGPTYGTLGVSENSMGSRGGDGGCVAGDFCYGGQGGLGGGAISLIAEQISIEGAVSTNGANGGSAAYDDGGGGGGSGGGILIRTSTLHLGLNSRLSARGGNGGAGGTYSWWEGGGGGGGGGGRIKISYDSQATLRGIVYSPSGRVAFTDAVAGVMDVRGGKGGMHGGDGDRGERGDPGADGTTAVNLFLSTKSVSHGTASPGDVLTYEISVTNAGTTRAVTVTDQIPLNTTYVPRSAGVTPQVGTITDTDGIRWTGTLTSDMCIAITFGVTISAALTEPTAIINVASIDDNVEPFERRAVTIVNGLSAYLPLAVNKH